MPLDVALLNFSNVFELTVMAKISPFGLLLTPLSPAIFILIIAMSEEYFLKSKRLGFRTWTKEDIDQAMALWSDPEVTKYIGGPFSTAQVYNKFMTERKILRQHNVQYWPVFDLKTTEFIGCCGLRPHWMQNDVYVLSVNIMSAHWRNGYATEATGAVVEFAFNSMEIKGLVAQHHPEYLAPKELIKKLSFEYTHDEEYKKNEPPHPSYMLYKK